MATREESNTYGTCAECGQATKFAHMGLCEHGWFCRECRCAECARRAVRKRVEEVSRLMIERGQAIGLKWWWIDD